MKGGGNQTEGIINEMTQTIEGENTIKKHPKKQA